MRRAILELLAVALFASSSYGQSVIAVQSAGMGLETSESSISQAFFQNTTAGNTIIVAVDSGTPVTQVRDSLGNTYVKDLGPIGSRSYLFRASNIAAGPDTVTAVFSGSNRGSSIHIVEYSGLAPASPFDGASGANGHSSAVNCANVTTSNPNDLLVVYARVKFTLASTDSTYAPTDTAFDNWMGERRVSRAGTYTASFTQEPGGTFECLLAAYKTGSGGGGGNPLQITTATVPNGTANTPYSTTLSASGGTPPYTWSVGSGSLPPGLDLASTGRIAGAPTHAGSYSFTVQVRDSATAPQSATRAFSLTVSGSELQISNNGLPAGTVGTNYSATLTATGGHPPYTWSVSGGQLPPGLGLQASTGNISGTPTQAGAFTMSIQVRDSSGQTLSSHFNITVSPTETGAPTISAVSPNSGSTSGGSAVQITGTNFLLGAVVFFGTVSAPTVTVDGATQIQAVTPAHGQGTVDVTVRNPDGQSAVLARAFTYTTGDPPPGTQSLLAGMTPANFTLPAGWTLATSQDFETGSLPSGQALSDGASITCSFSHSGRCSATNRIAWDGAADQWIFNPGQLPGREFYLSYYDYGGGATFNEEYVLSHVIKRNIGGSPGFEEFTMTLQYHWGAQDALIYNDPDGQITAGPQGNAIPYSGAFGPVARSYGTSGWNQWEFWVRFNTPNQSDGFVRIYRNGASFWEQENLNMVGPVDMTGMQVEAGGWYTKNIWTVGAACSPAPGVGLETGVCSNFSSCACPPNPPIFKRYIDDIILLMR